MHLYVINEIGPTVIENDNKKQKCVQCKSKHRNEYTDECTIKDYDNNWSWLSVDDDNKHENGIRKCLVCLYTLFFFVDSKS